MNIKPVFLLPISLFAVCVAQAQSWNLAGDWNPPANPNGAWSYGEYVSGNTFTPSTYSSGAYFFGGSPYSGGFVYKNTGSTAIYGIDPGQVTLESDWGTAVARWTAPTSGLYDISLAIGGTTATEGPGYGNNFAQYAGLNINQVGQTANSFTNNVKTWTLTNDYLTAGTTVDAYVQNPGYANGGNTQTKFSVAAVPEPAAFGVLGLGLLGLIRRRKSA